jgi:hypothetical protein
MNLTHFRLCLMKKKKIIIRLNMFNHFKKVQRIKTFWGDVVLGRMTSF